MIAIFVNPSDLKTLNFSVSQTTFCAYSQSGH
jgi:hypothetical protein